VTFKDLRGQEEEEEEGSIVRRDTTIIFGKGPKIDSSEISHAGPNLPFWEGRQEARSLS
jgi:hypothetical protein